MAAFPPLVAACLAWVAACTPWPRAAPALSARAAAAAAGWIAVYPPPGWAARQRVRFDTPRAAPAPARYPTARAARCRGPSAPIYPPCPGAAPGLHDVRWRGQGGVGRGQAARDSGGDGRTGLGSGSGLGLGLGLGLTYPYPYPYPYP